MIRSNGSSFKALLIVLAATGAQTACERRVDAATRALPTEPVAAQNPREVGPSCPDVSVTSINSNEALVRYLAALRTAASTKDPDAMARLVIFPLQVNASPAYTVNNAVDLRQRFSTIFDDDMLKAIAVQKPDDVFCNSQGVMLGNGEAWIDQEGDRIGIVVVNSTEVNVATEKAKGSVNGPAMECKTSKHLVIVDETGSPGVFRYRSWNRPKPMTDKPDMEVASGSKGVEGTGPCRYTEFRFTKGNVAFVVNDDLACTGEEPPPIGSTGRLLVFIDDDLKSDYWCSRP